MWFDLCVDLVSYNPAENLLVLVLECSIFPSSLLSLPLSLPFFLLSFLFKDSLVFSIWTVTVLWEWTVSLLPLQLVCIYFFFLLYYAGFRFFFDPELLLWPLVIRNHSCWTDFCLECLLGLVLSYAKIFNYRFQVFKSYGLLIF